MASTLTPFQQRVAQVLAGTPLFSALELEDAEAIDSYF